ncbi:hypothetical protein TRVL_04643 [Trypanosoma vivax]|uniref:Uncharacterized protein n=1 Tax=Trypanosoma vivax (strain Y486) TaxID=1055687 RepID=G0U0H6_TRYVY|nr:hypothetical protein TRVL_04643 [Trypanosoma vivax]CCC49574.1 conserved hypothetical protein [Trypanosoma vivax Y486]
MRGAQFILPQTNEYQWRNLYIRKYGFCTYAPPMPKHDWSNDPCVMEWQNERNKGKKSDRKLDGAVKTGEGNLSGVKEPRISSPSIGHLGKSGADGTKPPTSPGQKQGSLSKAELQSITDTQLFSVDLVSLLDRSGGSSSDSTTTSSSESPLLKPVARLNNDLSTLPPVVPPRKAQTSVPVTGGGGTEKSRRNNGDRLLALQQETWQLLMDNRIMMWFEREADEQGRIAASVQKRLLKVVSKIQEKCVPLSKKFEGKKKLAANAYQVDTFSYKAADDSTDGEEEDKLMQTLERFSPFFAIISPPELLQRLVGQSQATDEEEHSIDFVGIPIFSQYRTWREAFELRQAWRLSPFSFFLVHDGSYNHAHISALYVMVELICKTSHSHTAECTISEQQLQEAAEQQARRRRAVKVDEMPMISPCPLVVLQQLTEDILLAYEQGSTQTTLLAILQVLYFLTNIALDGPTASRFLSPDALRRQCGGDQKVATMCGSVQNAVSAVSSPRPGLQDDASVYDDKSAIDDRETVVGQDVGGIRGRSQQLTPQREVEEQDIKNIEKMLNTVSLKQFSEENFEELFELVYWFVDVATANSYVQEKKTNRRRSLCRGSVSQSASRRVDASDSKAAAAPGDPANVTRDEGAVSRVYEFEATASVVEAIIRFEMDQRNRMDGLSQEGQRPTSPLVGTRKGRKKRAPSNRQPLRQELTPVVVYSGGVSLLKTPLTVVTTYIRLHGAAWLKELLSRLFNVLRRESVLLYVNETSLEHMPRSIRSASASVRDWTSDNCSYPTPESGTDDKANSDYMGGTWKSSGEEAPQFHSRSDRLEDFICQDIRYVMGEFFSALHGKRSMTRLPQGISAVLTSFCTAVHLHLLGQHTFIEQGRSQSVSTVKKCIAELRRQRMAGTTALGMAENAEHSSLEWLIRSVEGHRLAKFVLFDCWILPALNNTLSFGYFTENVPMHLRWNVEAFARYLKIVVNSPFVARGGIHSVNNVKARAPSRTGRTWGGSERDRRAQTNFEDMCAQRCNTVKLPSLINGLYNIHTGALVRLGQRSSCDGYGEERPAISRVNSSATLNANRATGVDTGRDFTPTPSNWYDLSSALSALNEYIGLIGGDVGWTETYDEETDLSPAQILNVFCARASCNSSAKVVVSEYTVPPVASAACISRVYSLVSGQHPLVRKALSRGALVGGFASSPYLTCLVGVLTHPWTASVVADNIYRNSRSFYNTLMKPIHNETLLGLMSSLVVGRGHLPLIDSNQLISALASVPTEVSDAAEHTYSNGRGQRRRKIDNNLAMWNDTSTWLFEIRSRITTNAGHPSNLVEELIKRANAPTDPSFIMSDAASLIVKETGLSPVCFDTWWRATVVALTVKAMNVIEESSEKRAAQWNRWCDVKLNDMQKEFRSLCSQMASSRGETVGNTKERSYMHAQDRWSTSGQQSQQQVSSASSKEIEALRRRRSIRRRSIGRKRRK